MGVNNTPAKGQPEAILRRLVTRIRRLEGPRQVIAVVDTGAGQAAPAAGSVINLWWEGTGSTWALKARTPDGTTKTVTVT